MRNQNLARIWIAVLAFLLLITLGLHFSGLRVKFGAQGFLLFWCTAILLIVSLIFDPKKDWIRRVLMFGHGMQIFAAIGLCGGLASYWIASVTDFPFSDALLYQADLMIGIDWREAYALYVRSSWIWPTMQNLYMAIFYTPMLVLLGLSVTGQGDRIELFLLAFAISLAITLAIFSFFPARTALIYLIGSNPPYIPVTGLSCADIISDLRDGNLHEIDIHKMFGLVTFPSFHAASGVILAWACWTMRLYRWPIAIVSAGMIVATPLEGAHYFVDVIGGIWVAVAAIYAARWLKAAPIPVNFRLLKGPGRIDRESLSERT